MRSDIREKREKRVAIKAYAGQRLYCPDFLRYVTAKELLAMTSSGTAFTVIDAATGGDVTPSFCPIIVEH